MTADDSLCVWHTLLIRIPSFSSFLPPSSLRLHLLVSVTVRRSRRWRHAKRCPRLKIPGVGLPARKAINPPKWSSGVTSTPSSGRNDVWFWAFSTPDYSCGSLTQHDGAKWNEIHGTCRRSIWITFESKGGADQKIEQKKSVQPWSLQFIMVKTSRFHFLGNCLSPLLSLYGHSGPAVLCIARPLFLMERKSGFSWAVGNPYRFTRVWLSVRFCSAELLTPATGL